MHLRVKRCSCCGSTDHRIESCPFPGAEKIRQLTRKVNVLTVGRPQNKVLRTEHMDEKSMAAKAGAPKASAVPANAVSEISVDAAEQVVKDQGLQVEMIEVLVQLQGSL